MAIRYLDDPTPKKSKITYLDETPTPEKSLAGKASDFLRGVFKKTATPEGVASSASSPIVRPISAAAKIVKENPEGAVEAIPAAMNAIGGVMAGVGRATPLTVAPGMGLAALMGAGAEGFRQTGRVMLGKEPVPGGGGFPGQIKAMAVEGGKQAVAEGLGRGVVAGVEKVGKKVVNAGIDLARRAQGFQKSQLVSSKSWGETLRKIAQSRRGAVESLERGDIPMLGGAEGMLKNSQKLLSEGATKVKTALELATKSGKTVSESGIDDALLKGLNPSNADELAAALKIRREVTDLLEGGKLTPEALTKLRSSWGQMGFRDKTVGSAVSDMYRKAWKVSGDQLKSLLEDVHPNVSALFKEGMRQEEMANVALSGITNRIAREEGNYMFSLPGLMTQVQTRAFGPTARMAYRAGQIMKQGSQDFAPLAVAAIRGMTGGTSVDESIRQALDRRMKNAKR